MGGLRPPTEIKVMNNNNHFTWVSECEGFFARHRLSNGQFCQIAMYQFENKRDIEFDVVFAVADKKKNLNGYFNEDRYNNIRGKMTGRCGAEALFWCRKMLLEFEKEIVPRYLNQATDVKIVVYGEDQRRQQFYARVLPRLGFSKENTGWGWGMVKRFEKGADDD